MAPPPELDAWMAEAAAWLAGNAEPRPPMGELVWGEGSDAVALFKNLSAEDERAHVDALRDWQRRKSDAGYGSITWDPRWGGSGLTRAHEQAFERLEAGFLTPEGHESVGITLDLIGPTILVHGTDEQKHRYLPRLRRTDDLWCQLFSEPGAGSDLAGLQTRAVRDGDEWVLTGQKVWTSGAQFAAHGYLQARTDPAAPKHQGLTAFLVPMGAPGVEVRPLRQMSGGSSFNEVFLDEVRVPDAARLGGLGEGWQVALTTLGFERMAATKGTGGGPDLVTRLIELARHLGRTDDPVVRQRLAQAWIDRRVRSLTTKRAIAAVKAGGVPGPEGSIGKLAMTESMRTSTTTVAELLGPSLTADTGEWGTFAWGELLCGLPGFRIAGGTDEIQRTIIAERALGLPREPRP